MSTTVWKGHIAFGLVSFPVKLHAAARSQSINFHQLHQCDQARVKQVLYCQAEDRPVSRAQPPLFIAVERVIMSPVSASG